MLKDKKRERKLSLGGRQGERTEGNTVVDTRKDRGENVDVVEEKRNTLR